MKFALPHNNPERFEKIGEGTQKRAYRNVEVDPDSATLAFKWPYRNEEIKAMFYIQKIAHLIFPNETVAVKQVGSGTDEQGTVTAYARTEYVSPETDPTHQRIQALYEPLEGGRLEADDVTDAELSQYYKESRKDTRVQAFVRAYAKAGLENRLAPLGRQDRIEDGRGGFKYVDIAVPWYIDDEHPEHKELLFDPKKLQKAISQLPEVEKQRAQVYYDRLLVLCRSVGFEV